MTEQTQVNEVHVVSRPWLAPLIATVLALILFVVLLVPGVLRYRAGPDQVVIAALEDGNQSLREEIERLGRASHEGVCRYEGALYPEDVENRETPPEPSEQLDLLPEPASKIEPQPEALPEEAADFDGSMDDLLRASTVLVFRVDGQSIGHGSGFFISPTQIVTNAHVVGDAQTMTVTNDLIDETLTARVIGRLGGVEGVRLPQPDYALLELDAPVSSAIALSLAQPARTQEVYASGYPGFFVQEQVVEYARKIRGGQSAEPPQGVVTNGIITTVQSAERNGASLEFMAHSARISPGNSGGPLVDTCGRVVGINTFARQSGDGSAILIRGDFALSGPSIAEFLRANGASPRVAEDACSNASAGAAAGLVSSASSTSEIMRSLTQGRATS